MVAMLAFSPAPRGHAGVMEKWVVLKGCVLRVEGRTNVNRFCCTVTDYPAPDTLVFYEGSPGRAVVPMSGCLGLPVFNFDCVNNAMTADLRKTLKAKEFPRLHIYFLSLKKYPALTPVQENIHGTVRIELAGTSKEFAVSYRISRDDQQIIHLVGTQNIKFSDFNLSPPRKLGGMVRADNELDVEFQVNLRAVED